ncbi:hypothetical protein [Streptomyces variegatus]|jgi:hypothetical protein|uniref:hypothetical protein n=1 Tax=Streptomyces variegatus TaxID=284040 RepID=UPI003C2ED06C
MADGNTTWINTTRERVGQASNVVKAQSEIDSLAEADTNLDRILQDLSQLAQASLVGKGMWWTGVDAPADLWKDLRASQSAVERRQLASVTRHLDSFKTRARNAVLTAWKDYVTTEAGDAAELRALVQTLADAESFTDVARSLDETLGRLSRLQKDLPNAHALQTLREAVGLLDDLQRRLPDAVKTFVSAAASSRGASLELFDAEVRDWLLDNGAFHSFRVVPGRPQEVPRD